MHSAPVSLLVRWVNFHVTSACGATPPPAARELLPTQLLSAFGAETSDGRALLLLVRQLTHHKRLADARMALHTSATPAPGAASASGSSLAPPSGAARRASLLVAPGPALPALSASAQQNAAHALELAATELAVTGFIEPVDITSGHAGLTALFVAALFAATSTLGLRKRKAPRAISTAASASGAGAGAGAEPRTPNKLENSPSMGVSRLSTSSSAGGSAQSRPSLQARPSLLSPTARVGSGTATAASASRLSVSAAGASGSGSDALSVSPALLVVTAAAASAAAPAAIEWEEDEALRGVLQRLAAHDAGGEKDDDREERAFRNWINACALPEVAPVHNLFVDLRDGLTLLKLFDHIEPGSVDWSKVERKPTNKFKACGNCNQALAVGRRLKFSLVGIDGSNVFEGQRTFTLALVWQMMRYHTIKYLQTLYSKKYGNRQITDAQIIVWANNRVSKAVHPFLKAQKVCVLRSLSVLCLPAVVLCCGIGATNDVIFQRLEPLQLSVCA
jgi:hypothetical protein